MNKESTTGQPEAFDAEGIMKGIAEQRDQAFSQLCAHFRPLIFSTVYRVVNNWEESEDLTQDVLLTIWKKAGTWDQAKGKLSTWIISVARNRAIDLVRSKGRRAALRDKLIEEAKSGTRFDDNTAHDALNRLELKQMARRAVVDLKPEQREAIELEYFEGLTQREVALRIGIPLGTAKARIRRGVHKLRESLPQQIES